MSYHRKWWCPVILHCSHCTWIIPWLEFITLEDPSGIQGIWQGKIVWKQLLVKWRILFKLGTKNLRRGNKGSSWRRGNRLTDGRPSQQQAACPGDSWKAGWPSDDDITEWAAQWDRHSFNGPLRSTPNVQFYNSQPFHFSWRFKIPETIQHSFPPKPWCRAFSGN